MYKSIQGSCPPYIQDLVVEYTPARRLRSSTTGRLVVPRSYSVRYGGRRFDCAAAQLWNTLPLGVRRSASIASFKMSLKSHLPSVMEKRQWSFNEPRQLWIETVFIVMLSSDIHCIYFIVKHFRGISCNLILVLINLVYIYTWIYIQYVN